MSSPTPTPSSNAAASATTPVAPKAAPQGLSPERLDEVVGTTKPRGWIALIALCAIVLAVLIWSLVAVIPQQSSGVGVVSSIAYTVDVTAPVSGVFHTEQLTRAQGITEGQTLGTISPYDGSSTVTVKSPTAGSLNDVVVDNGSGVDQGQTLGRISVSPSPSKGILIVTYLSAATASTFFPGQKASVEVTNLAKSKTTVATAEILSVASSPSSQLNLETQAGSQSIADVWSSQSGGNPFRVNLLLRTDQDIPADLIPQGGQPVNIVNEYGTIHPIQLLFGGK